MSYIKKLGTGYQKTWKSTGIFTDWERKVGWPKRTAIGILKAADLALVPLRPEGTYLERLRLGLFRERDQRRLYSDLVWIWPIMSPPEDYIEETEVYCDLIKQHSKTPPRTLLHLGCGGGHNDYTLGKHFKVTGVDLSPAMLALARGLNPEINYLVGDMRTVRLNETFDAVTILDSINYMRTEGELKAAFQTAYDHLKAGGVFLTFVEERREELPQNRTQCTEHQHNDIHITFIENTHKPDPTDTTYEATMVFLIRQRGKLQVEVDYHTCGVFTMETWKHLMQEVGFEVKEAEFRSSSAYEEGISYPILVGIKPLL